jgi:hypothetical protein
MVFLNFQNGESWKGIQLSSGEFDTYDIILSDLNNDKRLDILESNSDEINYFYFNRLVKKKQQ